MNKRRREKKWTCPVNLCLVFCLIIFIQSLQAETITDDAFLKFIQSSAARLRGDDQPPTSAAGWLYRKSELRSRLQSAWGGFFPEPCELEPQILGTLPADGYKIEKLLLQTLPDVWMTANAYVPAGEGPFPAVLCVHGHWRGAKTEPTVQKRCIGLAKLGFFVLMVDALGAGERGIKPAIGEYHGEMVAATLLPVGRPLSGLQVYENMRAVDYLITRPEVDRDRIGITGASGGGNQTMYAAAWDERFRAAVPVCSVGNYQAYLGAACCMCEVVPGALQWTEEGEILGLVAPRNMLVINASQDSIPFSIGAAKTSLQMARPLFELYEAEDHLRHTTFDWKHDYSQPMREAMYGWMSWHLQDKGTGEPIPEPELTVLDPELLRCFPGDHRPENYVTLPSLAKRFADEILERYQNWQESDYQNWLRKREQLLETFEDSLLGQTEEIHGKLLTEKQEVSQQQATVTRIRFSSEPGIVLTLVITTSQAADPAGLALWISMDETEQQRQQWLDEYQQAGYTTAVLMPRALGDQQYARDKIGRAVDHTTAEWSLWLGRPLLGQWVCDTRAAVQLLEQKLGAQQEIVCGGYASAAIVALTGGLTERKITHVDLVEPLVSYRTNVPYEFPIRLGILIPHLLPRVGDVPQLAAMLTDKKLTIRGSMNGQGGALNADQLQQAWAFTRESFRIQQQAERLRIKHESESR